MYRELANWNHAQSPALCPDYSDYSPFYTYSPMCVHDEISNEPRDQCVQHEEFFCCWTRRLQQQSSKEQRARFIKRKFLRGTKEGGRGWPIGVYTRDDSYSRYVDGATFHRGGIINYWQNSTILRRRIMHANKAWGWDVSVIPPTARAAEAIKNFDCQLGL